MALQAEISETVRMCRHCFMCRHANPTFLVTKLDAHTPRGYALALSRVDDGLAVWSSDLATKLFQSTMDGLCSTLCEFGWREDLVVQAGRGEAVRVGMAPPQVARAAERRVRDGADAGGPEQLPIPLDRLDRTGADVLFLTGIDARERAPSTIAAVAAILDEVGCEWTALAVEHDPGIDLWELGYDDAAAAAAARFAADVAAVRPSRIVTGSSRVLRALRRPPIAWDTAPLPGAEHISEFLLPLMGRGAGGGPRPGPGTVAYHDPCSLGRRLEVYDAPRRLIEHVTGSAPREFPHQRERAECCGDGGVLPEIDPELAARLAAAQLARSPEGVDTIVTGCPGCRAQLGEAAERSGGDVRVLDITELVADGLGLG